MKKYSFIAVLLIIFLAVVFLGMNQSPTFNKTTAANQTETNSNKKEPAASDESETIELLDPRGRELLTDMDLSSAVSALSAIEEPLEEELVESEESEESEDLNDVTDNAEWANDDDSIENESSSSQMNDWSNSSQSYSGNPSNNSTWKPSTNWKKNSNTNNNTWKPSPSQPSSPPVESEEKPAADDTPAESEAPEEPAVEKPAPETPSAPESEESEEAVPESSESEPAAESFSSRDQVRGDESRSDEP